MKYKRILLKLSGEALMGDKNHGIDPIKLDSYAKEIKKIYNHGIQIAIVGIIIIAVGTGIKIIKRN